MLFCTNGSARRSQKKRPERWGYEAPRPSSLSFRMCRNMGTDTIDQIANAEIVPDRSGHIATAPDHVLTRHVEIINYKFEWWPPPYPMVAFAQGAMRKRRFLIGPAP